MDLKDIAAVSGKGGLFKVLKPTRSGVILESIDEAKTKLVANANNRVSILKEISVYTTSKEASIPLENVFLNIFDKYGKDLKINSKSNDNELKSFLESVVPDYDTEKVYNSDIKKIISWYNLLVTHYPEIFTKKAEKPTPEAKKAEKATAEKEPKAKTSEEGKVSKKETEEKPKAAKKAAAKKKQ